MKLVITADAVVGYTQCPRKAYLLLYGRSKRTIHEYVRILEAKQRDSQTEYLQALADKEPDVGPYTTRGPESKRRFLTNDDLHLCLTYLTHKPL